MNSTISFNDTEVVVDPDTFRAELSTAPRCACGALARPNILMFGDWGWTSSRTDEQERRMRAWLGQLRGHEQKVVVIESGAGSSVPTVRRTSEQLAHALSGTLVRINPTEPAVPEGHIGLPLGSLEALSRMNAQIP